MQCFSGKLRNRKPEPFKGGLSFSNNFFLTLKNSTKSEVSVKNVYANNSTYIYPVEE